MGEMAQLERELTIAKRALAESEEKVVALNEICRQWEEQCGK